MFSRLTAFTVLSIMVISAGCSSPFYQPEKKHFFNQNLIRFQKKDVFFSSSDGTKLHGWFFPASSETKGTILYLHGNAENISTHVNSVLWLTLSGFNLFAVDYRGYGLSEGTPTIHGVHLDAEAALAALLAMDGVSPDRIAILGQSLGGAIACYTAVNSPNRSSVKAVISDSAFSSYRSIVREKAGTIGLTWLFQYPISWFFDDTYSPVRWIGRVSPLPILILHGREDPIVPLHHAEMLFDAAREPKQLWRTTIPGHIYSFAEPETREKFVNYLVNIFNQEKIKP